MKLLKSLIIIFLTIIVSLSVTVNAQQVSIDDFKAVLISAIQSYFASEPKVTSDELKDMMYSYFGASGNIVDLSEIGTFSGQKLEGIYNKAKGAQQQKGPYYDKLSTGILLNQELDANNPDYHGYFTKSMATGYPLPPGSITWFIVDPKTEGKQGVERIAIWDWGQTQCGIFTARVYHIDRDGNLVGDSSILGIYNPSGISFDNNQGVFMVSTGTTVNPDTVFLVEVYNDGMAFDANYNRVKTSQSCKTDIWWKDK